MTWISHYHGYERLALWFRSSNLAGAWLAMIAVLLCGGCLYLREHNPERRKLTVVCTSLCTVLFFSLLAATYSRGAYLAALLALGAAALLRQCSERKIRPMMPDWSFPVLLLIIILCYPSGGSRLAACLDKSDLSILHRLHVWKGGCMLIHDYALSGVGQLPGKIYSVFYQPLSVQEHYCGFINDYLTLSGIYGLPIGTLLLACLLLPLGVTLGKWKAGLNDTPMTYLAAAFFAYLICGYFSECHEEPAIRWTLLILALLYLLRLIYVQRKHKTERRFSWLLLTSVCIVVPLFCAAAVYIVGIWGHSRNFFKMQPGPLECISGEYTCFLPRKAPPSKRVIAIMPGQSPLLRSAVLQMVSAGWEVRVIFNGGGLPAQQLLREEISSEYEGESWSLLAAGNNGNAALCLLQELPPALQPDRVWVTELFLEHPFEQLSLEQHPWNGKIDLIPEEPLLPGTMEALVKILPGISLISDNTDYWLKTAKQ